MKKPSLLFILLAFTIGGLFWWYQCGKRERSDVPEVIMVGTSADFPPFSYKENGIIVGFDIDIVEEAVKRLGKQIEIKDMPFELLMPQVQLGTVQVLAAGMTETVERAKRVFFAPPHLQGDALVAISLAKCLPITTFNELKSKTVIVNQGYTADVYLSKIPGMHLIRLPALADAILALRTNKADALVTAASTFKPFLEQYGQEEFSILVLEEAQETASLVISKHYPVLAEKLSRIVEAMLSDGTIEAFKQKWQL